jgi:hypothetical protein
MFSCATIYWSTYLCFHVQLFWSTYLLCFNVLLLYWFSCLCLHVYYYYILINSSTMFSCTITILIKFMYYNITILIILSVFIHLLLNWSTYLYDFVYYYLLDNIEFSFTNWPFFMYYCYMVNKEIKNSQMCNICKGKPSFLEYFCGVVFSHLFLAYISYEI